MYGRTDVRTDVRTDIFPPLILLGRLLEVDLKTKPPDRNNLKFGAVVVPDTVLKLLVLGSKVSGTGSTCQTVGTTCRRANKNTNGYGTIFYENYVDNVKLQYIT